MDFQDLIERAPSIVSVLAALGILLLLPLLLSQRRDVLRLRAWRERDPDYAAESVAASEASLDRAEAELELLAGDEAEAGGATEPGATPPAGVTPAAGSTPAGSLPAATRVTSERPALERVTMERAALQPHPHWRRFAARATQPRILVVLGIVALVLAIAGIFASQAILDDEGGGKGPRVAKVDRSEVTVAVLNATAEAGLAQKVGSDLTSNQYLLGTVGGTGTPERRTLIRFADGERAAGRRVARDLGVELDRLERLDRETQLLAGEADVVVVVGEDRAKK